jgi:hypothetical protein
MGDGEVIWGEVAQLKDGFDGVILVRQAEDGMMDLVTDICEVVVV